MLSAGTRTPTYVYVRTRVHAQEVKDAWYNKRAIIPAGTLVPVAFETYGTLGARGDAYTCATSCATTCGR